MADDDEFVLVNSDLQDFCKQSIAEDSCDSSLFDELQDEISQRACDSAPPAHLCVPGRLHIAILISGTRGDVQPFILVGQLLKVRKK